MNEAIVTFGEIMGRLAAPAYLRLRQTRELEVRFDSDKVRGNQNHVLEYYLLNHPLDCPVCDKAGECHLQDYT